MPSLPTGSDYSLAVQTPAIAFEDADLKVCAVELNKHGLPKPYSGGFTTTYRFSRPNQQYAVRCFTRAVDKLQVRYSAISSITRSGDPFVSATCLQRGILVHGHWHPIIKMGWVNGAQLNSYIQAHLGDRAQLERLREQFRDLISQLGQQGIAHGDLQHGNIIVDRGKLCLIDYDGMYVPALAHLRTNEIGHINYQHPLRAGRHYDATIDRFSSLVIYLGLLALCYNASLWGGYDNGENILFRRDDFHKPHTSKLLLQLRNIPDLADFIDAFKRVCQADFEKVPTLEDFLSRKVADLSQSVQRAALRSQYKVLDATRPEELAAHVGQRVEVVGFIDDGHSGDDKNGDPYVLLNFGRYPYRTTFTLVFWADDIKKFGATGISLETVYRNRWVSVKGTISAYKDRCEINVEVPSEIEILTSEEAIQRLKQESQPAESRQPETTPTSVTAEKADSLDRLYGTKRSTPSASSTTAGSSGSTAMQASRQVVPSPSTLPSSTRPTPPSGTDPRVPAVPGHEWVQTSAPRTPASTPSTSPTTIHSGGSRTSSWWRTGVTTKPGTSPSLGNVPSPNAPASNSGISVTLATAPSSSSTSVNQSSVHRSPGDMLKVWPSISAALNELKGVSPPIWLLGLVIPVILTICVLSILVLLQQGNPSNEVVLELSPDFPSSSEPVVTGPADSAEVQIPSTTLLPLLATTTAVGATPAVSSTLTATPSDTPSSTLTMTASRSSTLPPTGSPIITPSANFTATVMLSPAPVTYVVRASLRINARSCPRLTCSIAAKLDPGERILVVATVQGDGYRESTEWYQILVDGKAAYIHSSLASSEF